MVNEHETVQIVVTNEDGQVFINGTPRILDCSTFHSDGITDPDKRISRQVSQRLTKQYKIKAPEKLRIRLSEYSIREDQDVWLLGDLKCSEDVMTVDNSFIYPEDTDVWEMDPRPYYWNPFRQLFLLYWILTIFVRLFTHLIAHPNG